MREVIDDKIGDLPAETLRRALWPSKDSAVATSTSGRPRFKAMCVMLPGKLEGFVCDLKDSLMPDIEALLLKAGDEKEQMSESELAAVNERLEAQPAKLRQERTSTTLRSRRRRRRR